MIFTCDVTMFKNDETVRFITLYNILIKHYYIHLCPLLHAQMQVHHIIVYWIYHGSRPQSSLWIILNVPCYTNEWVSPSIFYLWNNKVLSYLHIKNTKLYGQESPVCDIWQTHQIQTYANKKINNHKYFHQYRNIISGHEIKKSCFI